MKIINRKSSIVNPLQPIGTLRDLGTPRQWAKEIALVLFCAAILLLIYIVL